MSFFVISVTVIVLAFFVYLYLLRRYRIHLSEIETTREIVRNLNILNEMTSEMNMILEKEAFFNTVLEKVKTLLRAEKAAVVILEEDSEEIRDFFTTMGESGGCKTRLQGILKKVVMEQSPVRSDNIYELEGFEGFPDAHPKIKGIIAVPIILRGKTIGVLMVADKTSGQGFTVEDEDLLLNTSFHMALALEKLWFYDRLQQLANLDGLTGLYNHRAFQVRLREEIERSRRKGLPMALLMCDLDHFKIFNDTYGHLAGDEILKEVSRAIKASIRKMDIPARYGGEEFAIILPESSLQGALLVGERIRQAVEQKRLDLEGRYVGITISIGIAIYPEDGEDPKNLIASADLALYHAKRSGRNRVCTYKEFISEDGR